MLLPPRTTPHLDHPRATLHRKRISYSPQRPLTTFFELLHWLIQARFFRHTTFLPSLVLLPLCAYEKDRRVDRRPLVRNCESEESFVHATPYGINGLRARMSRRFVRSANRTGNTRRVINRISHLCIQLMANDGLSMPIPKEERW